MAKSKSSEAAQAQPGSARKAQANRKPARPKVKSNEEQQSQPLDISPENRGLQERVSGAAEQAMEVAEQAMEQARKFDAGEALGFAKKHSIPLAILGLSAYWIFSESQRPKNQEKLSRVKGKLTTSLSEIKEKASDLKEKAGESLGEYSGSAQQALASAGDNPLIIAAVAGGIGLALGLMLPLSSFENETFRAAREQIAETVQEKVDMVTDKVSALKDKAADVKEMVEATVSGGSGDDKN